MDRGLHVGAYEALLESTTEAVPGRKSHYKLVHEVQPLVLLSFLKPG